jgi:hypothetical protein
MAARLGIVIYWLGVVIAIPIAIFAAFIFYGWFIQDVPAETKRWELILGLEYAATSFASWLLGRIALYILAGR